MHTLSRADITAALMNVTKSERSGVTFASDFDAVDWPSLDFYGWRDPKFPQRGYLVRGGGDDNRGDGGGQQVVAAAVTTTGGLPPGRKAMCALCRAVDDSSSVALFSARRAGPAGRRGDSVGTYVCSGLDCSAQLRDTKARVGRTRLDGGAGIENVAAEMVARLDGFLNAVAGR